MKIKCGEILCGVAALSLMSSLVRAAPDDGFIDELQQSDIMLEEAGVKPQVVKAAPKKPEKLTPEQEDMARGEEAYRMAYLNEAVDYWNKAAKENYAPAQSRLGEAFTYTGEYDVAVGWYILAANQGNVTAEWGLGNLYLDGKGVKKDMGKAAYWIERAAKKDWLPAVKAMDAAHQRPSNISFLGEASQNAEQAAYWKDKRKVLEAAAIKAEKARVKSENKKLEDIYFE